MNKTVPVDTKKIIKILDDMLAEKDRFTEEEIETLTNVKKVIEALASI